MPLERQAERITVGPVLAQRTPAYPQAMLAVLSPAKTLDLASPLPKTAHSQPRMLVESQALIDVLLTKSPEEIAELMHISIELAELNAGRYRDFERPFTRANARPAVLMFNGDVYQEMDAAHRFGVRDFTEAQKTLRILSGLYGLLRPLDLIQPYRLEMGTRLRTERGGTLLEWWGSRITDLLRDDLQASPGADVLVNLASAEYIAAVDPEALDARIIAPRFENQDAKGVYRVLSFSAKRARGEMAGWLVRHRVRTPRALADFAEAGYRYAAEASLPDVPVFRRPR